VLRTAFHAFRTLRLAVYVWDSIRDGSDAWQMFGGLKNRIDITLAVTNLSECLGFGRRSAPNHDNGGLTLRVIESDRESQHVST
jgi:hypothetical protein